MREVLLLTTPRRRILLAAAPLFLMGAPPAFGFAWTPETIRWTRPTVFHLASSSDEPSITTTDTTINGSSSPSSPSSSLITTTDSQSRSQLFDAFTALDLNDQYDAVLTGLCATRILDNASISADEARTALQDPLQLLREMIPKRIPASPRSLMALIDSAVKTQDASCMHTVLTLARQSNANIMTQYASRQADIQLLPSSLTQRVQCADGTYKTRGERLERIGAVPSDNREEEIVSAIAFAGLCGACVLADIAAPMESVAPALANGALLSALLVGAVDNFYDLFRGMAQLAQRNNNSDNKPMELPDKSSLPFGLGTGQLTGKVVSGLSRLLTVDAERESQCEAAALFCAYHLGLACFAFRPNALEASALVIESTRNTNEMYSLDNAAGYLKLLIWLLAPVCAENMKHSQLIMSNPREAMSFLDRLEKYDVENPGSLPGIWWQGDAKERDDLLAWAYAESEIMLRQNRGCVQEVSQCLTGGAATVGDCVAVMERW